MTDPPIFESLLAARYPPRRPLCPCERCGKQLYTDSCGNYQQHRVEGTWNWTWTGVCMACLRDDED